MTPTLRTTPLDRTEPRQHAGCEVKRTEEYTEGIASSRAKRNDLLQVLDSLRSSELLAADSQITQIKGGAFRTDRVNLMDIKSRQQILGMLPTPSLK